MLGAQSMFAGDEGTKISHSWAESFWAIELTVLNIAPVFQGCAEDEMKWYICKTAGLGSGV